MNPQPRTRSAGLASRPRFRGQTGRLLLLRSGYFLEREIQSACSRLGWPLACLDLPPGPRLDPGFLTQLLEADTLFRPDFALTVNHLGLDQQGVLLQVFERLRLPLASWFVDSPRLILHEFSGQQSPWLALFTWDKDTLAQLSAQGFDAVTHLPLATDSALFTPGRAAKPQWSAQAAFVGDSMAAPVARLEKKLAGIAGLLPQARSAAAGFVSSPHHLAATYLAETSPDLHALASTSQVRLDLEQYVTFEATRQSRLERVRALLPFHPLIAGDAAWKTLLPPAGWAYHPPLDYYADLPGFYPACAVNLNATSLQMKGAVNQRAFDVPACGGFLLTDARAQLAELFEPGKEVAVYADPEEIPDLINRYLRHPESRAEICVAARTRILAQHDYTHRLRTLYKGMRRRYA